MWPEARPIRGGKHNDGDAALREILLILQI
jgi:hypothetical protein